MTKHQPDTLATVGQMISKIKGLEESISKLTTEGGGGVHLYVCRKKQLSSSRYEYEPVSSISHVMAVAGIRAAIENMKAEIEGTGISIDW
jgi:hypothetical protein